MLAGHVRIEAAKLLGMAEMPTIRLDQISMAQRRAYSIADNKLAEKAGWDRELVALELATITELDIDSDLTLTDFETDEIDILPEGAQAPDEVDNPPEINDTKPTVTWPGDLWILGGHILLCADATRADSFDRLLHGEQADLVFIDPTYNVPINGNVGGFGSIRHREFATASGELSHRNPRSRESIPSLRESTDRLSNGLSESPDLTLAG